MALDLIFEHYDFLDSTNDEIRRRAAAGAPEGLVVFADAQTSGKGRRGRTWQSDRGSGAYTSILLRPNASPSQAASLATVVSLSAVRMVKALTGKKAMIKWPNDIVYDGRKLCGILCETGLSGTKLDFVIAGIGTNVHQTRFDGELSAKAISLDMLTGAPLAASSISRENVVHRIWSEFVPLYETFLETLDMSRLRAEYEEHFVCMDRPVYIEQSGQIREAVARGIDTRGALLAEIDGHVVTIDSGEVSVRGIYGYV